MSKGLTQLIEHKIHGLAIRLIRFNVPPPSLLSRRKIHLVCQEHLSHLTSVFALLYYRLIMSDLGRTNY